MNAPVRKRSYADSDVADRTIILDKAPSAFVERWADRGKPASHKVARQARGKQKGGRGSAKPVASGVFIDDAFVVSARRLYEEGLSLKGIARQMGCSTATVSRLRRRHAWSSRRAEHSKNSGHFVEARISLPKALLDQVDAHVFVRSSTRSAYLRKLIRRDLGL